MKSFILNLNESLKKNKWLYVLTTLFLCVGFVLGIYTVYYMGQGMKTDIGNYLNTFIETLKDTPIKYGFLIFESFKNNGIMFLIIFILGLVSIGGPFILILLLVKGYAIGFTLSMITIALGGKGVGISLIALAPQNLLIIPAIIIFSTVALEMSILKLKSRFGDVYNLKENLSKSLNFIIVISCVVIISVLIESLFSSTMLRYLIMKI